MYAAISADIVSSTSLSVEETILLNERIKDLFLFLEKKFDGFKGRQIKGDYIECIMPKAKDALRIGLLIISNIKYFLEDNSKEKKDFLKYGLRMAIGIGQMRLINEENSIWDGEAIYMSGRQLEKMKSPQKGTLEIISKDESLCKTLHIVGTLTINIMNQATRRQSEVFFYKLLKFKQQEIAKKLNIKQSSVNMRLSKGNWHCIEEALNYFESIDFDNYE